MFGLQDKFHQICSQSGLSARKQEVRHANLPKIGNNLFPLVGLQFRSNSWSVAVAEGTAVLATIRKSKIHARWCGPIFGPDIHHRQTKIDCRTLAVGNIQVCGKNLVNIFFKPFFGDTGAVFFSQSFKHFLPEKVFRKNIFVLVFPISLDQSFSYIGSFSVQDQLVCSIHPYLGLIRFFPSHMQTHAINGNMPHPMLRKWYYFRFFFLKYPTHHPSPNITYTSYFHFQALYLRLKGEKIIELACFEDS